MQKGGSSHWCPWERGLRVGFRGVAGVVLLRKMREKGKGVWEGGGGGGGVGTGKGTGKSMHKLCRNYPWATYSLKVPE